MVVDGVERLVPVVVKIGRHNLDREFLMGKTSIGLMLLSSQYWAPHGKLTPFLKAMTAQIDGFIEGFRGELQFEREAAIQARFAQRAHAQRRVARAARGCRHRAHHRDGIRRRRGQHLARRRALQAARCRWPTGASWRASSSSWC